MKRPRPAPRGDLTVFITSRAATCDECGEDLGRGAWITLADGGRAVCLACADLDHLVFLPAGDAALSQTKPSARRSVHAQCITSPPSITSVCPLT